MGIKKRVTVNAKITEEESIRLNALAERENISVTAIIRLLVDGLLNGEIELEKGEIKSCPTHDEYCVLGQFTEPLFESKIEKELKRLSERGYPDRVRFQIEESIAEQIRQLPKYEARRMKSDDWGC